MLKQYLQFKLSQKLSPQQIQLMKLIQLPTMAFEQRLKQEIEENPALEMGKAPGDENDNFNNEDDTINDAEVINTEDINIDDYLSDDSIPDYKTRSNNYSDPNEDKQIPYASGISFNQFLSNQLNTIKLSKEESLIAEFIVGSIDDSGYLRRELTDILDDLAFTQNIFTTETNLIEILSTVQELDPPGVGARTLQECLSIQLKRKINPSKFTLIASEIIDHHFEQFTKKHYSKLLKKYELNEEELRKVINEIEKLNPKPGGSYSGSNKLVEQIVPDFTIRIIDGELELTLNGRNAPQLHISRDYNDMLNTYKVTEKKSKSQKEAVQFIKQKLDGAKWFIEAIIQRQQTLFVTMSAIMNHQKDYFLTGDEKTLKPMILRDIAENIDMDISTVSRVANSKYVDTPYGTKLIKSFFSESVTNDQGEEVSTKEIKAILKTVIEEENKSKPLTDEKLALVLKEKGYPIARRTVAKYREQLDFPVARLRKEI
jgi:RNA polymerase sigma-54 factor